MNKGTIMPVRSVSSSALEVESGERSEPDGTGRALAAPDPEVRETPVRRRFSAEYKLRILRLADACTEPGSLGALLRREGLYASNLRTWRRQRDAGTLEALKPKKRGRKPRDPNPLAEEVERLRKDNERLAKRLRQAELIIEVQKKVSRLLGIPLDTPEESD
jgi:transposase-like protein